MHKIKYDADMFFRKKSNQTDENLNSNIANIAINLSYEVTICKCYCNIQIKLLE